MLFDPESKAAQGRMLTRVLAAMTGGWWEQANCIVDGLLGKNFYDVGFCAGKLAVVVFDVTLG